MQITASCFIQSATTGFTANAFPYHHRVSLKEAFEGPEPDDGKLSRPVLRGPAPSNGGWLLGERGPAVTKQSKQKRTARMLRQLRSLGYRIEPPNPQPSQAQAQ